ncbi:MAG: amidohydrolase family protein, partial [Phycisphaerales bacterium]
MTTMFRSMLIAAASLAGAAASAQPVTVYFNGNIITVGSERPRATALAVQGERIVAVGTDEEVRRAVTERGEEPGEVDLKGRTVLPGLTDCHGHIGNLGAFGLGVLELSSAKSFDEAVAKVKEAASKKPAGEWVLGGRWDHESWEVKALPSHAALSEATPEHPVWLRRVDGHAAIANRGAMELAGVTRETKSPSGGEIVRDEKGEPTGVFVDNAMALIQMVIPASARGEPEELILKAQEMCLASGLTSVHDAGVSPGEIALYQRLQREGRLKLRVYAMVSGPYALKWFDANAPIIAGRG